MLVAAKRHLLRQEAEEIIRRYICESSVKEGEYLPPQRDLADVLQVSRTVVREALSSLEARGILEIRPGAGVVVRNPSLAEVPSAATSGSLHDIPLRDLLDFTCSLNIGFADLICKRATEEDIQRMEQLLERMESELAKGRTILREVQEFSWLLLAASRNPVVTQLRQLYAEADRRWLLTEPFTIGRPTDRAYEHLAHHREMVAAVKTRDAARLEAAFRLDFDR